jgi:hypothetical protein
MSINLVPSPTIFVDGIREGSCSCVWTDGMVSYLLTASHVVSSVPEATPVQWMAADGSTGDGQTLDTAMNWMALNDGKNGLLDASFVQINHAGPFDRTGSYPWASTPSPDGSNWLSRGTGVVICGKSASVFATYDGVEPPGATFSDHVHGSLLRFTFDLQSRKTLAGDSGGPVISTAEGMLIGVHVGITDDGGCAWAVAIQDVLTCFRPHFLSLNLRP